MTITPVCVTCILNQVEKTLAVLDLPADTAAAIRAEAHRQSESFSFAHTPPFVAKDIYQMISRISGNPDPLFDVKQESIVNATQFLPLIRERIEKSDDRIFTALKAAVAGNVIDFGAKEQFYLAREIAGVFDTPFAVDDYRTLAEDITVSDDIMILADNSGENVFDRVLMEAIREIYPHKRLQYVVRGNPIINDITRLEAEQVGIGEVAEIVDSGVDTPGLDLLRADPEFVRRFEKAPLVIAKGMGNYECLEASGRPNLYFLFKVKCEVVADAILAPVGSIILKRAG
jgi:uncharacterized protein with ATP-grasp and redox domains